MAWLSSKSPFPTLLFLTKTRRVKKPCAGEKIRNNKVPPSSLDPRFPGPDEHWRCLCTLFKTQVPGSHPRPTEPDFQGVGPGNMNVKTPPQSIRPRSHILPHACCPVPWCSGWMSWQQTLRAVLMQVTGHWSQGLRAWPWHSRLPRHRQQLLERGRESDSHSKGEVTAPSLLSLVWWPR